MLGLQTSIVMPSPLNNFSGSTVITILIVENVSSGELNPNMSGLMVNHVTTLRLMLKGHTLILKN